MVMASLPSRHRSLFLLLGVLLLQVLLLAVQIKRDSQGRLIRVWTVSAVSPVERSGAWGDGNRKGMGVITPEGVVGKVMESFRDTSQVLVLTDRDGGVGAMIADSRIQSPVSGTGEPLLAMKFVGNDDEVSVGQRVVTSGMDRIFPK